MNPPLPPPTDLSIPRIRPWSRSWRLFPNETELGAYLPVGRFSDAVIRTGYTGPWSLEVFNNSLADQRREVPMEHATRAMRGLKSAMEESYARVSNDQPGESAYTCGNLPIPVVLTNSLNTAIPVL